MSCKTQQIALIGILVFNIATGIAGSFSFIESDAEISICSSLRKKHLCKNMVNGVNVLSQSMLRSKNTIYIISDDYSLCEDIVIPPGSILRFAGGSINGKHSVTGTNTFLEGEVKCFSSIAGTFANDLLDITWVGAVGNDKMDNTFIISNVIDVCRTSKSDVFIPEGVFAIKNGKISLGLRTAEIKGDFVNTDKYLDYNGIKVFGTGEKSVIKSYYNGDVINLSWLKNLHLEDLNITSGIGRDNLLASNGQNMISLIDCENVSVKNCYCHDSYWKPRIAGSTVFCDGGSGITLQGRLFHNIEIRDCRVYNCMRGFDIVTTKWFVNDSLSSIRVSNIQVEKCFNGIVVVNNFGYDGGLVDINEDYVPETRIVLEGNTVNCKVGTVITLRDGLVAEISNTSSLSIESSLLSGYGAPWLKDLKSFASIDNNSVYAAYLTAPKYSSISINSSYRNVTSGYMIDMHDTNNGKSQIAEYNSINLKLNDECATHDVVVKGRKTKGYRLNIFSSKGKAMRNSKLSVEGCMYSINGDTALFRDNVSDKTSVILDGKSVPVLKGKVKNLGAINH